MTKILVLLLAIVGLMCGEWPDFLPPVDSGVVNVKLFGAVGDGKTDDTEAIRTAIAKHIDLNRYAAPVMIYLPAGTYLVSGPIEGRQYRDMGGWSSGWRAGFLLVGQGRTKTVIQLKDAAAGFTDATKPQALVATGSEADGGNPSGGGNRAFRHCVSNLTIDVGKGNPGAVGLDFIASNRGTVENVLIRAPAGSGSTGLAMNRGWPGPALIKHVEIQGFSTGIAMAGHWQYSMTFEDIVLRGQTEVGVTSDHNPIFMRRLTAVGESPVFRISNDDHLLVLIDAVCTAKAAKQPAIITPGIAYLRNVVCTGFSIAVDGRGEDDVKPPTPGKPVTVDEWSQGNTSAASAGAAKALALPVEETPLFWPSDTKQWVNGAKDLQAAIDSGAPVVYLPNGSYEIDKTIVVRGSVRKIVGFQSSLKAKAGVDPLIRIEDTANPVIFEHLWLDGNVVHVGRNSAAFRHVDFIGHRYQGLGKGRTFIEDVIGTWRITGAHKLWARQTNAEFGGEPLLINDGGTAWILGFKTEGEMVCLRSGGGATELLGGIFYPLRDVPGGTPAIDLAAEAQFSGSWVYNSKHYPVHVRFGDRDITGGWGRGPGLWSTRVAPATPAKP